MPREIPVRDDFPEGFHRELARLVLEFGRIEYLIKLCHKDLQGKGFAEGMSTAEQADRFHRLCENTKAAASSKLSPSEFTELCDFLNDAKRLSNYRNDSVHAYWTMENDHIMRVRPRWDGVRLDWSRSRPVPLQEMAQNADEMRRLYVTYDRIRKKWILRK